MDLERARLANQILDALLAAAPEQREAMMRLQCEGDPDLELLVRRLAGDAETASKESSGDSPHALRHALESLFGERSSGERGQVGGYRLLHRLGSGGAGDVYLAERDVDGQPQQVAIKFLRGNGSEQSIARFRQEQQILAQLSHPAIGKLIDFGHTIDGAPYFVTEYVDGPPIDEWCSTQALDLDARLKLMIEVIEAVHYAHRTLVVHRDLKPSNVLVDSSGRARVLDFGIAKLLDERSLDPLTEPGGTPATLGFASPEQLRGEPAAVTSDVYQLGVLLYLLVVGVRPLAGRSVSREEALRMASSGALAPSEQLRKLLAQDSGEADAIARERHLRVRSLLRRLAGDLDQIVLKAMAVHPDDRYQSASALADDLRLLLEGRPVSARRAQWRYVFGKLLRRHPLPFALGAALMVSLVVFAAVVTRTAIDLDKARRAALQQGALSDRVLDHVVASLRELEPKLSGFQGSIVRQALDRAATAPIDQFGSDPLTQAHLRLTLGRGYEAVWDLENASAQYEAADALLDKVSPEQRPRVKARVRNGQGRMLLRNGDVEGAAARFSEVVAMADGQSELADQAARALVGLAALADSTDNAEARILMRRALADYEGHSGPSHPDVLNVRYNLSLLLLGDEAQGTAAEFQEAESVLAQLVARAAETFGEDAPLTLSAALLHGRVACYAGRFRDCESRLSAALPSADRVLGSQNLSFLKARSEYARALLHSGQTDAALTQAQESAEVFASRWNRSGAHSSRHSFGLNLAEVLLAQGDSEAALNALREFSVDPALVMQVAALEGIATIYEADSRSRQP